MDYSLLMGVHNIDLDVSDSDLNDQCSSSNTDENYKREAVTKSEAWKSLQLDFNTSRGPYEYVFLCLKFKVFFI